MLKVIKQLHNDMQAKIITGGTISDGFEVKNGVRQGCCLASLLFKIYAAAWTNEWNTTAATGIPLKYTIDVTIYRHAQDTNRSETGNPIVVKNGQYIDDAVSLSSTRQSQVQVAQQYQQIAKQWGQKMSIAKTKRGGNRHHKRAYRNRRRYHRRCRPLYIPRQPVSDERQSRQRSIQQDEQSKKRILQTMVKSMGRPRTTPSNKMPGLPCMYPTYYAVRKRNMANITSSDTQTRNATLMFSQTYHRCEKN